MGMIGLAPVDADRSPRWRAALQRSSAALPGMARVAVPFVARMGERRRLSR